MQVNGAYNIRQTGNGIVSFVPKNSEPTYVGGTFSWNQLIPNTKASTTIDSVTVTNNGDGSWTLNGTKGSSATRYEFLSSSIPNAESHIWYVGGIENGSSSFGYFCASYSGSLRTPNIYEPTVCKFSGTANQFSFRLMGNQTYDNFTVKPHLVDLTLMLGSTIADYAYALESGNAGDGVAWLRSQGFFKKDYYAYDAGSLQNVETEKAINTGLDSSVHTYALGHATLRGLPKLDTNNNLYYDGDTYESNGKITRRYKVINLGDQNWSYNTSYTYPYFICTTGSSGANISSGVTTVVCTKYEARTNISTATFRESNNEKKVCVSTSNATYRYIQIQDSAYTDATTFKAAMDGVYLVYLSVATTTESSASFESLMFAEAGGTEQLIDYAYNHGTRDVEIPVGAKTDYGVIRYAGYLLAVRDTQDAFTPIPLDYMRYETYNVAPDQRLDLDTTRDTTGVLHRTVLAHTATKVSFNVPSMPGWRIQELLGYFRTAFKQTNGDTQAHKLELKYYDEWEDEYKTGIMYMPDITFQIRNIDGRTINYSETKVTFIEY